MELERGKWIYNQENFQYILSSYSILNPETYTSFALHLKFRVMQIIRHDPMRFVCDYCIKPVIVENDIKYKQQ
jgi:hypothetical protein